MMHLTCTNMNIDDINDALDDIKSNGIQNVLALRGDPPPKQDKFVPCQGGFDCALDLVNHIRNKYGDYFGITVAGYPEAHPDVIEAADGLATPESYANELFYLKKKVDAGADLIVTQLFLNTDIYLKFVNDCRQVGINCPIVPGIYPIRTYRGFLTMTGLCKTNIPHEVKAAIEPIKDNAKALEAYGIHFATEACKKILAHGINTIHLYTMNVDTSAIQILKNLGLIDESKIYRSLPWRRPANFYRMKEDVRPIFWANRPESYISRTKEWNNFPHGRWHEPRNVSYGTLSDYKLMCPITRDKKLHQEWVVPLKSIEDVHERFKELCLGNLTSSPWSELDGLKPETKIIQEKLVQINSNGFLTINSQPLVNAAKSDSLDFGWGNPGGYVYQKAYLEFFCSKDNLDKLVEKLKACPCITYMAMNKGGDWVSNIDEIDNVNAVTWGVFPCKEIIQPTIVDANSFKVWREEAFEIWSTSWANLYPQADHLSINLLEEVIKNL
ncbi:unnamed protein product [Cochlearia groenlandica]